ncbi:MAG TPA: immunoglobulin domain-containing protein [Pseudomonadales bacterium]|nr:immunoglobulin domain-containing protein [Pseudomonadales bacterium]
MIRRYQSIFVGMFLSAAVISTNAATILDDTFADGTRNIQNLPTESAWYCSSGSSLTAAPGAMTLQMGSSAILATTYFTTSANNPVSLNVGDTLSVNITYTFTSVAAINTSQGFRLALCHFGASRANADYNSNSGQGTNVEGYAVFQNMGINFNNTIPTSLMLRTNIPDKSLLGTGNDWELLGAGPGSTNNFPGFTNNVPYTLQLSVQRTDVNAMQVTATWLNDVSGATLSTAVMDTSATNFNFDGLGLRPLTAASTASGIIFNEVQVGYVAAATPPSINANPQDQSIFVGQSATFSVVPDGTPPFTYQWLYNNDTVLTNQTNATLTINNAQLSDTGGYSVIVSNAYGSVTSDNAELTVTTPTAPVIVTQPQSQTVIPGQSYTFTVVAGGSQPFSYQWYYNTNTPINGATSSSLALTNIQVAAGGAYSVVVSNFVSATNSSYAVLSVNTNPVAPSFVSIPASLVVLEGNNASFSATVLGTQPIGYQWSYNNVPIPGATSLTLTLTNVQTVNSGSYTITASNSAGAVSSTAILTVTPTIPVVNTDYNLTGFAQGTTGGGVLPTNNPAYAQVFTATDLANALNSKTVKIIEIMNDLNLGYTEIEASAKSNSEPFRPSPNAPLLHPVLLQTGVSVIDIQKKNGLTIFSANGSTIRHAKLNVKNDSNIIIRNLKFDQLWEWDEATKGQYDENDWDFITLGDGGAVSNIWVDHCTFTKSYDGIIDTKAGCSAITISWCHYTGDDGATNSNSWVWQQINYLEQNPSSHPMYNFLRTRGFSTTNIVTIMQGHDKTHLAGQNDLDSANATISMTFHHLWLNNVWDRCVPRLRAGNVHDYNLYVNDTLVLAAKRLRDSIAATMSTTDQNTLNNTYDFNPPINGAISTESGALLLEKSVYTDCVYPLRNNQTDPSDPEYTGKILGSDVIYHMDNADGTTTDVRGNSTDPGNPLGPFQAPIIPFSWNLPNNQLPYTYTVDDPVQLPAIVTSPTAGAGAGVLTWDKTNWLVTSYAPTAPFIVAQPQNVSASAGQSASFTVLAGGTANLGYQWYFNTNTPVPNANSSILTLTNVQSASAGVYTVVVTNIAGTVTSTNATLAISGGSSQPQVSGLVYANGIFSLTVSGGSGSSFIVQGSTNLVDWINLYTNFSPTPFTWSDSNADNFSQQFYRIQVGQ